MRTRTRAVLIAASLTVTVFLTLGLSGCSSAGRHYEVTPEEFIQLAEVGAGVNTMHGSQFIGVTDHRAFLSVWSGMPSSVGGGSHVYSVAIDDLPTDVAQSIRSGRAPWNK